MSALPARRMPTLAPASKRAAPQPEPGALWALFLGVDGGLVELPRHPEEAVVPDTLLVVLSALNAELGGALALVSGRTLEQLDRLFAPLVLPSAGQYGIERRSADGHTHRAPLPQKSLLDELHRLCYALLPLHPGLKIEDKGESIALRYHDAPQLADTIVAAANGIVAPFGGVFETQPGEMVQEIMPATSSKGGAVHAFLREQPFLARMPVFVGDDRADDSAFAAVNALGGISIGIGAARDTLAKYHLPDPAAARAWLAHVQQVLASARYS